MSSKEANLQFLQNYLEELRRAYGYAGLAFELPESRLNTAKKMIAWFDSLDADVRKGIVERFGQSPEGFRALLAKGEEIYYDRRYAHVSPGEKVFYITIDYLFKDIIRAVPELKMELKSLSQNLVQVQGQCI